MARIELKYCTIRLKDGLTGTGAANNAANPAQGDTTLTIGTLAVNSLTPTKMPIGARFRIAGEKVPVDHVVTARTQDVSDPTKTTEITFAPALGEATSTYEKTAALTIKPQQLDIKIGDGNLTYTEHRDYTYLLDRGWLDTVREPKDVPMDVKLDAVYEHIVSATGEHVCPMEALKGTRRGLRVGQFVSRPVRAVLHRRGSRVHPALRPVAGGNHAVPDVPGRDPRDQLQRGDDRVDGQVQGPRAHRHSSLLATTPRS